MHLLVGLGKMTWALNKMEKALCCQVLSALTLEHGAQPTFCSCSSGASRVWGWVPRGGQRGGRQHLLQSPSGVSCREGSNFGGTVGFLMGATVTYFASLRNL